MMGSVPVMVRTWTMASDSRKALERKKEAIVWTKVVFCRRLVKWKQGK